MRSTIKQPSAFTLVEMLVVIAILSILAMLAVNGVNQARESAGVTQCMSNLRQVHAALMGYVQDHNGMLPGPLTGAMTPHFKLNNKGEVTKNQLAGYLAPYLEVPMPAGAGEDAFNYYLSCPAHLATMTPAERKSSAIVRSYGIPLGAYDYPFGYTQGGTGTQADPKHISQVNPATTWMLRDDDQILHPGNAQFSKEPIHKKGRNHLYFDGSVRFQAL